METETYEVHPLIAAEIPKAIPQQVEEAQVEQVVEQPEQRVETAPENTFKEMQARNFKELKKQKEKAERERDEYAKLLSDMQSRSDEPEDVSNFSDDTLIEGKHLNKYDKKYDKKFTKLQNELKQTQQLAAQAAMKYHLRTEYPDFDKVVTQENIEKLQMQYPELAQAVNSSNDIYVAGKSAYSLIKKFDLYTEDNYESDRYKVKENNLKPRPVTSITSQQGASPLAKANAFANGLTKELQKQLLEEMAQARKGI